MDSKAHPSVFFRSVVIVSCIALLLGVAGIFYFQSLDRDAEAVRPPDACVVMVQGLKDHKGVHLEATWLDTEGTAREEQGKPMDTAGHWMFENVPPGSPIQLRILVSKDGRTRLLHGQPAILTRGGVFEVWLRAPR